MIQEESIRHLASLTGLTATEIHKVYKAYWKAVKEHITSLPLDEDLTDEEFSALQPNVNIPSLGKLYVTPEKYRRMKNFFKEHNKNQIK